MSDEPVLVSVPANAQGGDVLVRIDTKGGEVVGSWNGRIVGRSAEPGDVLMSQVSDPADYSPIADLMRATTAEISDVYQPPAIADEPIIVNGPSVALE